MRACAPALRTAQRSTALGRNPLRQNSNEAISYVDDRSLGPFHVLLWFFVPTYEVCAPQLMDEGDEG